jgi:hypothetical protein
MVQKCYKIPIYFGQLRVIIAEDFKEADKKYKLGIESKLLTGGYESIVGKLDTELHKLFVLIHPDTTYKIVAHECVHLVNYKFLHLGIELDRINDEPQAYLTGWFFETICKAIGLKLE